MPASRIIWLPSESVSSTHEVFPPYRAMSGVGVGIDPRVPQ